MPPLPAAVSAGLPFVSQGLDFLFTQMANRQQQRWNESMYERQNADNLRFWNMNNEYNSPAAQMARLKAAGLNPNLVYGQGAVANSSGPIRAGSPGSYNPAIPKIDLGMALTQGQDLRNRGLQNDLMNLQMKLMNEEIRNKRIQGDNMLLDGNAKTLRTGHLDFDLQFKRQMQDINKRIMLARANGMEQSNTINLGRFDIYQALGNQALSINAGKYNTWQKMMEQQYEQNRVSFPFKLSQMSQGIRESIARIDYMASQKTTNEVQQAFIKQQTNNLVTDGYMKDLELVLKQKGLSWNDPWAIRVLSRISDFIYEGVEAGEAYKRTMKEFQWDSKRGGGSSW